MIKMPALRPILIPTKGHTFFVRLWIWITATRTWEVIEDWHYTLPDSTVIIIPAGFIFDGASIPRPLWWLLSPTGLLLIPGLIHDFAYRYDYLWQVDELGIISRYKRKSGRDRWDKLFKDVGREVNGMSIIDVAASFILGLFGWFAWDLNRKLNAPEIMPASKAY